MRYAVAGLALTLLIPAACRRETNRPVTVGEALAREHNYPEDWSQIDSESARLFQEGRKAESTAMLQKVVDAHPDFAEGHFSLAMNHEFIAKELESPGQAAARTEHLEAAVHHYQRFRELMSDPLDRAQGTRPLVELYGPDGLNRIDEAVKFARLYVGERPDTGDAHAVLAAMLRRQGSPDLATVVLVDSLQRVSVENRPGRLMDEFVDHVNESPNLPRATAEHLLAEALASAERQMADPSSRGVGLLNKAKVLRTQAGRLEQDPVRKKQLAAEAERLQGEGTNLILYKK